MIADEERLEAYAEARYFGMNKEQRKRHAFIEEENNDIQSERTHD